ncbi:MAG: hypothetical protein R2697_22600 [Ilumatobacteraceae bacterium]
MAEHGGEAGRIAGREASSLREDQIRSFVGLAFMVLSLAYLIGAVTDAARSDR